MSYSGLTDREVGSLQQQRFGPNKYSVPRRSYLKVLFGQLLSPFFVFQVFCISLWALDEYWYYSLVTLAMILVFEMTVSIQRYRSFQEMEQMLKGPYSVCVYRNNAWVQVSSHHLVPGDLIDVKSTFLDGGAGKTFPCDAVLLNGSVLVNEAMLTGESDYKWKTSSEANTDSKRANHMLYAGTTVIKNVKRSEMLKGRCCVAYCVRTGFMTKEGEIMRSIFFTAIPRRRSIMTP